MENTYQFEKVIKPPNSFINFNIKELLEYREIFYTMVYRHITIRYTDTIFGSAHAIFLPFFTMIMFTFLFGIIAKFSAGNIPYPLFLYSGLILWTFFSTAVSGAANSIISNGGLLTKIYIPPLYYPLTPCIGGVVDYCITFILLIIMMLWFSFSPGLTVFLLPLIILATFLLAFGIGCILASITVKFRDMQFIMGPLLQIMMYTAPILYPLEVIPEKYQWIVFLNPITGLIVGHRQVILGSPMNIHLVGISFIIALVVFLIGLFYLRKTEYYFADLI